MKILQNHKNICNFIEKNRRDIVIIFLNLTSFQNHKIMLTLVWV